VKERDRVTKQYVHDGDWDRLYTCGHKLGIHSAAVVGGQRDCFEPGCECLRFVELKAR
jgi:hypothetical protein